eukprot:gene20514-24623_t
MKPVLSLPGLDGGVVSEIANVNNKQNLCHAMSCALLMLPDTFTEYDLYHKICSISYMGDIRMKGGENPNKIHNIVVNNILSLRAIISVSGTHDYTEGRSLFSPQFHEASGGHIDGKWHLVHCPHCHSSFNRDFNAANNIFDVGYHDGFVGLLPIEIYGYYPIHKMRPPSVEVFEYLVF